MAKKIFKCPEFSIFEGNNSYVIKFEGNVFTENICNDIKVHKIQYVVTEIYNHFYVHKGVFCYNDIKSYIKAPSEDMAKTICNLLNQEL